jgi:hypothetical protein
VSASSPTKLCSTCRELKPLEDFNRKTAAADGRQSICRACSRLARPAVARCRRLVWDYLLAHPCVDCGESDPVVLDFDHREPADKAASICVLTHRGVDAEVLLAEISKCDVRCGNCHRCRTINELGWWRALADAAPRSWWT